MTSGLDTRSVPSEERRGYWSAGIAERFFPMHVESVATPTFEARLACGQIGPVAVRSIQSQPHRVVRTQRMVAAADPECILLYLPTRGAVRVEQDDRSCVLKTGGIAYHDTSRPSAFEGRDGFEVLVFSVPKWFIGPRAGSIARRSATVQTRGEGGLAPIAIPFLVSLARTTTGSKPLSDRDGDHAADMLLALLRSFDSEEGISRIMSRSELLLERMQQYASEHLHEPALGPADIAQAHFVSTRYVHKLFAAAGTGVSAWIRERRLEGAAGELRESPGSTVAAVAARWGYPNPASFSRAFRDMHGCAPRDMR